MEKHIEDVKQDEKTIPDLLEPKITKIRVSTFWIPEI